MSRGGSFKNAMRRDACEWTSWLGALARGYTRGELLPGVVHEDEPREPTRGYPHQLPRDGHTQSRRRRTSTYRTTHSFTSRSPRLT